MMENVTFETRRVLFTEKAFYQQYDSQFNIIYREFIKCIQELTTEKQ